MIDKTIELKHNQVKRILLDLYCKIVGIDQRLVGEPGRDEAFKILLTRLTPTHQEILKPLMPKQKADTTVSYDQCIAELINNNLQ